MNAASTTPRALIYTRVSTEEQAENGTSLHTQRAECLRLAERRGAAVIKVCQDAGVSGARYETRPALMEALARVEAGEVNLLLVSRLDRLGRSARIILDIMERIDRAGGQVATADGQEFGNTPAGRMLLTMLSGVAEMERGLIRERTATGRRAWAARGVMPARARSPFGYHIVNHKDIARGEHSADALGKYVLVPDEARWMPEVFARFAGGASLRQVAAWLNQQGVRPPGGKEWHGTGIRRMLINPVYKGIAEFGRLETVYDERRVTERGLATDFFVRKRPEETWIRLSAPALVDEALWATCQEQLSKNQQVYGGNPERKFMLSGLVRCPVCGYRMGGDTCTNRRGTKTRSYKCYPSRKCGTYQNAPALEHSVVKAILWAAEHPEHIAAGLRAYDKQKQNNDPDAAVQRRQELEAELARLDARAQATARAQVTALMAGASENDFTSLFTEIRQRREALEAELRGIAAPIIPVSQAEPETAARKVATVLGALEEVLTAADEECTPAEKQALLAKVVDRITPDGEQVSIALRSETVPIVSTMTYPCRSSSACAAASPRRPRAPRPSPFVLPAATQVF